jgi:hypothetical protein
MFDAARRVMGAERLGERLGISEHSVDRLEHGGHASPETVARVVAALRGAS